MTKTIHAPARHDRARRSRWLFWPSTTALLGFGVSALVVATSIGSTHPVDTFLHGMHMIGRGVEPAFARGFDALSVLATLLVAVAAATGLTGDWSEFSGRVRTLIHLIIAPAMVVLFGIATFTLPTMLTFPERIAETILLWLCAWIVLAIALGVQRIASPAERYIESRARLAAAFARAHVIADRMPPERKALRWARLACWAIPIAGWCVVCLGVTLGTGAPWESYPVMLATGFGLLLSLAGWQMGADRAGDWTPRAMSVFFVLLGWLTSVALAFGLYRFPPLGIALAASATLVLILLLPRAFTNRAWPFRVVVSAATARGVNRQIRSKFTAEQAWRRARVATADRRSWLRRTVDAMRRPDTHA